MQLLVKNWQHLTEEGGVNSYFYRPTFNSFSDTEEIIAKLQYIVATVVTMQRVAATVSATLHRVAYLPHNIDDCFPHKIRRTVREIVSL